MHRSIQSHLQWSYPSFCPWYTESYGETVALKQLSFSSWLILSINWNDSWKANVTEGNFSAFQKVSKCVSTHKRARKQPLSTLNNELSNLSPSSETWWCLVNSASGVCYHSIPSLSSNRTTADSAREKAECFNSACASKSCVPNSSLCTHPTQSHPTAPGLCLLHLRTWRRSFQPSILTLQLDRS